MGELPDDTHKVTVEGITVEKTFDPDQFSVPVVRLDVVSDREEPASVRITDAVPASLDAGDVGFRREYEDEPWTGYTDVGVEIVRVLEPFEHVTAVYGMRTDDAERARECLTSLSVEVDADGG